MNFKTGQKLVCIGDYYTRFPSLTPKKNEIVTFDGCDGCWILLREYTCTNPYHPSERIAFDPAFFRPLLGDSAKSELISSFTEVTETSDCPIKQPQTETV